MNSMKPSSSNTAQFPPFDGKGWLRWLAEYCQKDNHPRYVEGELSLSLMRHIDCWPEILELSKPWLGRIRGNKVFEELSKHSVEAGQAFIDACMEQCPNPDSVLAQALNTQPSSHALKLLAQHNNAQWPMTSHRWRRTLLFNACFGQMEVEHLHKHMQNGQTPSLVESADPDTPPILPLFSWIEVLGRLGSVKGVNSHEKTFVVCAKHQPQIDAYCQGATALDKAVSMTQHHIDNTAQSETWAEKILDLLLQQGADPCKVREQTRQDNPQAWWMVQNHVLGRKQLLQAVPVRDAPAPVRPKI